MRARAILGVALATVLRGVAAFAPPPPRHGGIAGGKGSSSRLVDSFPETVDVVATRVEAYRGRMRCLPPLDPSARLDLDGSAAATARLAESADASCDSVLLTRSLSAAVDEAAMRHVVIECARVLHAGGTLHILDADPDTVWKLWDEHVPSDDYVNFMGTLKQSLEFAGFAVIETTHDDAVVTVDAWRSSLSDSIVWKPNPGARRRRARRDAAPVLAAFDGLEILMQFTCAYILGTAVAHIVQHLK
jgi:hypothetical protein